MIDTTQPAVLYSEGICGDGSAILRDGVPMTISEIVATLNQASAPTAYSPASAIIEDIRQTVIENEKLGLPVPDCVILMMLEMLERALWPESGNEARDAEPPTHCRQRIKADHQPHPKSSCSACGPMAPLWRQCDAALAASKGSLT